MKLLSRIFASKLPRPTSSISQLQHKVTLSDDVSLKRSIASSSFKTLYGHSSGRWLWNENQQLAHRWLQFDVTELARLSSQAVGSQSCTSLQKHSEGNFNKVFVLTMDDGKELIAKLPNPNAGRKHFTTASEVATMDYVRNVLSIPAPKVYSWSSSAENAVGAEYVLMEKCRGVELCKVWDDLTNRQKIQVIRKLVGFEKAFASSRLPMYGSLYYASDLGPVQSNQQVTLESENSTKAAAFAVGPTTDRSFFDHGRSEVTSNQGPWSTLDEYILAIAQRELACLKHSSQFPDPQGFYNGPGQYQQKSEVKIQALKNFEKVVPYLRPKDRILSKAALWHTDLHSDNIFVDKHNPTEITAIVDWQAVHIAPLFAQARHPTFLNFEGEIPDTFNPEEIKLPDNYEELSEEEQKAARKLRGAQVRWKCYELALISQCNDIRRAIRFGEGLLGSLPTYAGNVFSDGELTVEECLIQLQHQWDQLVDDPVAEPCPLNFTAEDETAHEEQFAMWAHSIQLMGDFLDKMGAYRGWQGWVPHEQYETGMQNMKLLQEEFLAQHASTEAERMKWMEVWPFKD